MSHFIPEPSKLSEATRLPADAKKAWLKANLKEIIVFIKNQTFIMYDPEKVDPVTPCMDVYKRKSNLTEVLTS